MKLILTFFLLAFTIGTFAQINKAVELKWKIEKNEEVNYLTLMSEIDLASSNTDFSVLLNTISENTDSRDVELKKFVDFLKMFYPAEDAQKFTTTLSDKGSGIVDIITATKPVEYINEDDSSDIEKNEIMKMMQTSNQRVVLRGSVFVNGGIHSFWVQNTQKNLIALLFELPNKKVSIGDKWQIDVNLISNDENFICDSSYCNNEVELADIKIIDNDTIAVVKYNIVEYVKGKTDLSALYGKGSSLKETILHFTYVAVAEFSKNNGRWISYDGIFCIETSGYIATNKKTKYSLVFEPQKKK